MTPTEMESLIRTLDHRMLRVEQILPTLATKEDLRLGLAGIREDRIEGRG